MSFKKIEKEKQPKCKYCDNTDLPLFKHTKIHDLYLCKSGLVQLYEDAEEAIKRW